MALPFLLINDRLTCAETKIHVIPRRPKADVGIRTLCARRNGLPRTCGARNDVRWGDFF